MLILSPAAMTRCRQRPRCRWCGRDGFPFRLESAHVYSRGCGGPEAPWNLVTLCREDHARNHAGQEPTHEDLKACAAADHDCLQSDIDEAKWCLDRLPRDPTDEQIKAALAAIPGAAARLVREAVAGHVPGRRKVKRRWPKRKLR